MKIGRFWCKKQKNSEISLIFIQKCSTKQNEETKMGLLEVPL
jgi:hypothetical protein